MTSETQAQLADGKLAGSWTLDGARSSVGSDQQRLGPGQGRARSARSRGRA